MAYANAHDFGNPNTHVNTFFNNNSIACKFAPLLGFASATLDGIHPGSHE